MVGGPGALSVVSIGFIGMLYKGWIPYSKDIGWLSTIVVSVIAMIIFAYNAAESRLWLWYECTRKTRSYMPVYVSRLSWSDIVSVIAMIMLKYLLKPLWLISGLKVAADGTSFALPEVRLDASLQIDERDDIRYDVATRAIKVPKKSAASSIKAASPERIMLLPALTNPIMSALLANRNCPVLAFGAVNVRNRFEFIDAAACRDPVEHLDLARTTVTGRLGGEKLKGRRVKRGMEFDVECEVTGPRKGGKQGKVVFKQVFTVLSTLSPSTKPLYKATAGDSVEDDGTTWKWAASSADPVSLPVSAPRKWAALCKDYNPIHVSSAMAKLFGFPGRIAHGNHVLAIALESMLKQGGVKGGRKAGASPEGRLFELLYGDAPSVLEVQFRRPMVLPVKLDLELATPESKFALRAVKGGKEYVTAQVAELRP